MFNISLQTQPMYPNIQPPSVQFPQLQQRGFNQPAQPHFCSYGNLPIRHNGVDYQNRVGAAQPSFSPHYYSSPCSPALMTPKYHPSPRSVLPSTSTQQKFFLPMINNTPTPMMEITITHNFSNSKTNRRANQDSSSSQSRCATRGNLNTQRSLPSIGNLQQPLVKKMIPTMPQIGEREYHYPSNRLPTPGYERAIGNRTPHLLEDHLEKLNQSLRDIDEKLSKLNNLIEEKAPKKNKKAVINKPELEDSESEEESDESEYSSFDETYTIEFEDEEDSETEDKNFSNLLDELDEQDNN